MQPYLAELEDGNLGLTPVDGSSNGNASASRSAEPSLRSDSEFPSIPTSTHYSMPPPESVDVLVGSPPCQPFSIAGPQLGTADERHLYPAFIGAVRALKPRWVLMEQVPAILSDDGGRSFGGYVAGLAALGYDLVWHCIPACAVGAPIQRDRVWIIAKSNEVDGPSRMGNQPDREGPLQFGDPKERIPIWIQTTGQFVGMGNGFSDQLYNDRVSAIGNAVVPQIPFLIGQAINEIEGS